MNSGSEFIGFWNGFTLKKVDAPEVISTGAVSPTARATPRISAVARPALAVGSTTLPDGAPVRGAEGEPGLAQTARDDAQLRPRRSAR